MQDGLRLYRLFSSLGVVALVSFISRASSQPVGDRDDAFRPLTPPNTGFARLDRAFNGLSPGWPLGAPHSLASTSTAHVDYPPGLVTSTHYGNSFLQPANVPYWPAADFYRQSGNPAIPNLNHPSREAVFHWPERTALAPTAEAQPFRNVAPSFVVPPHYSVPRPNSPETDVMSASGSNSPVDGTSPVSSHSHDDLLQRHKTSAGTVSVTRGKQAIGRNWQHTMQTILRNPKIRLRAVENGPGRESRVFVAEQADDVADHHADTLTSNLHQQRTGGDHFFGQLENFGRNELKSLNLGSTKARTFIYYDSRAHMRYLNNNYFQGRLRFLPIRTKALTPGNLNHMLLRTQQAVTLPPIKKGDWPILAIRHAQNRQMIQRIRSITGHLGNADHLVSFWSPMMYEDGRRAFVLYGIGQLAEHNVEETSEHLRKMMGLYKGGAISSMVDLTKYVIH
ncbi:uncharacterized protein UTRI_10694 [Ustilago trichophora]|uniref:Effector family protein Eff1 n=1 Tax=Ustilago trichophora TaxID=86804 RepID=A0A5C3EAM5_9BASI|nr:uncharacterized protein UTRI_10694 [Ustilago trichophora]